MLVGSIILGSIAGYFAAGAALILGHSFLTALVVLFAAAALVSLLALVYALVKPLCIMSVRRDPLLLTQEID
ncbi:MAG: hypothetical protein KDJ82_14145 [Rhodobacteraceae bacterium]|nr:hypothetical protein [Paracoccaceae bacterium]HMQ58562.1 hypothetical protein [Rhizobiaceae bacterium]